jgi:hypothetical protein
MNEYIWWYVFFKRMQNRNKNWISMSWITNTYKMEEYVEEVIDDERKKHGKTNQ